MVLINLYKFPFFFVDSLTKPSIDEFGKTRSIKIFNKNNFKFKLRVLSAKSEVQ